jgi:tetratricopeptide (TPR) repeat protein
MKLDFFEDSKGRKWIVIGICAALAILVFLVFGQTSRHEFVNYDDGWYVYANPSVTSGFTPTGVVGAFSQKTEGLWTPLVTISHMLDWRLYGSWAGGHHLTNVALHLGSVILLFLILLQMTGAPWRSAFVAALFAIHPLHVESVAWISERKDVLSGFFFMLTLGAYLRYVQRPRSVRRYLAVPFLFAIALMSKPMVVTLPCVLLLLDYWPLKRLFNPPPVEGEDSPGEAMRSRINWRVVVEKLPLLALSVGLCFITTTTFGPRAPFSVEGPHTPFWTRVSEAPVWWATYLLQMFWPVGLSVIYTHFEASLRWAPAAIGWMGAFSLVIFLVRRRHPYLWMGWLWNLGMLIPVLGFVQISRHARADHYNYLPQIGLYIGLTWLAADWAAERRPRRVALGAMAGVTVSILSIVAWRQTGFWRDGVTLWTHALECTKDNYMARSILGLALIRQGRITEGVEQCRAALAAHPDQFDAQYNFGVALFQLGSDDNSILQSRGALKGWTDEVISHYRQALQIDPGNINAHNNLGDALAREGRTDEAISEYRTVLRISPGNAVAHYNLGKVLDSLGQTGQAVAEYRESLRFNPDYADAHNNLGIVLAQQGQIAEAITHMRKALELEPSSLSHKNNLAWMLATAPEPSLRDGPRALALAIEVNQSVGGVNPNVLRTLAAAYAEAGRFPDAVRTTRQALQVPETQSNPDLADELQRELKLYEAGHRFENPR